ncbi:MAG: hypothetical protein Fur0021_39450 [Candidatus Promineifilaceae bacterium]
MNPHYSAESGPSQKRVFYAQEERRLIMAAASPAAGWAGGRLLDKSPERSQSNVTEVWNAWQPVGELKNADDARVRDAESRR